MSQSADATVVVSDQRDTGDEESKRLRDESILDGLGSTLSGLRSKAIAARVEQGIDQRWYEDVEAYEGRDAVSRNYATLRETVQGYVSAHSSGKQQKRSTLIINVTRSKVNTKSARLQEIALPTDDRNWDLRPSTVPQLVEKMAQKNVGLVKNGQPIMVTDNGEQRQATMADLAQLDLEKAKKRSDAMRDAIDDQLDISSGGCGYEGVVRQVMDDEALLGVGVAKGPVITSRVKKVWLPITDGEKTVHVLQRMQDLKPTSARVNPWDIYPHPECGENPKKFPIWERLPGVTGADLRAYAGIPGYIKEQIKKVLIEGPKKAKQPATKPGTPEPATADTTFDAWEYHGELTREQLEAAGAELGEESEFIGFSAAVIMVNDTVIKADIEILDTNEMPYDFFVTNKCSGSWTGYGTSYLARHAQKAITSGWRAMMDNAGQYIGAQTVIHRTKIAPADGKWEMRGPKLWWYIGTDDTADMGKLFNVHEIPAHQIEYANIIKMGMEFLDNETAIPMLAQGEQGSATDVMGGMNLLLNASNVLMRRSLKSFDDQFTIPHIGRYVDWNMQYNKNPEIKGDFEVQARASGALMDAEIQNKGAGQLFELAKDPEIGYGMKKWETVRRVVRALRFDHKDFVYDDAKIEQIERDRAKQGGPSDPRIEVAKIRAEADAKITAAELASKEKIAQMQDETKKVVAAIDERLKSTQLTSAERQTLAKIKGTLTSTVIETNAQKELSREGMALDANKHVTPKAELPQPKVEPAGRAKPGQSFAQ